MRRLRAALRPRRVRTIVGVVSLFSIPPLVPLLGLPEIYGKAQTARAGGLVDLTCADGGGGGGGGLRCVRADEIRTGTRRDDWWVLGYFALGSVAALSLASLRSRQDAPSPGRRGVAAVALLAAGGVFDLIENAQLRSSVSALTRGGVFPDRNAAIAAVGSHADATVLMGRFKLAFMATALLVVIWSLLRPPRDGGDDR